MLLEVLSVFQDDVRKDRLEHPSHSDKYVECSGSLDPLCHCVLANAPAGKLGKVQNLVRLCIATVQPDRA